VPFCLCFSCQSLCWAQQRTNGDVPLFLKYQINHMYLDRALLSALGLCQQMSSFSFPDAQVLDSWRFFVCQLFG
jgi:hypothetical protein